MQDLMSMTSKTRRLRGAATRGALLALLLAAAGCDGENLYRTLPTGAGTGSGGPPGNDGPAPDSIAPLEARILLPLEDARLAVGDSVLVRVAAADDRALDSVVVRGVEVGPGTAGGSVTRFQRAAYRYAPADTVQRDTVSLFTQPLGGDPAAEVLLVATVYDRAGNASADTVRVSLALIQGSVIPLEFARDRIVDIASDGKRVFLSNYSRNRVEVIDIASGGRSSFSVGSQPWGLALSPGRDTLYVANSGGTNISVVDLRADLEEDEASRIHTPNVKLFHVPFSRDSVEAGEGKRSVLVPGSVTEHDYSDRPQFLAQTRGGEILYSTKPTATAADGTIRRRLPEGRIEIFLDYARRDQPNSLLVVNALGSGLVEGDPNRLFVLSAEGVSIVGFINDVEAALAEAGSVTRLEYYVNLEDVGLQDTTFVAVSGDHRTVAFGEGDANPGRIMIFEERSSGFLTEVGDTRDLVHNAAERVFGLALNQDGTLGAARGQNAYFFSPDLRLQGTGVTGAPFGGIALHPGHSGYPATHGENHPRDVAFVSGADDNGTPYIDVIDTFTFDVRRRLFLTERVTGPMIALPRDDGAPGVHVYAVTATGVLSLEIPEADLRK